MLSRSVIDYFHVNPVFDEYYSSFIWLMPLPFTRIVCYNVSAAEDMSIVSLTHRPQCCKCPEKEKAMRGAGINWKQGQAV